jgi:uncharacterized phage-like protein YoqJ
MKVCTFFGYMPHKFDFDIVGLSDYEDTPAYQNLKKTILHVILVLYRNGYKTFMSGMNIGTEMWCAESVLLLQNYLPDLKLYCILPFDGQESNWSEDDKHQYHHILSYCTGKRIIADNLFGYRYSYKVRNSYLLRKTDTLLMVMTNKDAKKSPVLNFAEKTGHFIIHINPETFKVTYKNKPSGFKLH